MSTLVIAVVCIFNDTATTEIYTLSLHDALPVFFDDSGPAGAQHGRQDAAFDLPLREGAGDDVSELQFPDLPDGPDDEDRKSTRLNSSHANISYAVFCLKKKPLLHSRQNLLLHIR